MAENLILDFLVAFFLNMMYLSVVSILLLCFFEQMRYMM